MGDQAAERQAVDPHILPVPLQIPPPLSSSLEELPGGPPSRAPYSDFRWLQSQQDSGRQDSEVRKSFPYRVPQAGCILPVKVTALSGSPTSLRPPPPHQGRDWHPQCQPRTLPSFKRLCPHFVNIPFIKLTLVTQLECVRSLVFTGSLSG